ncbi:MAG: hypothetical protein Q7S40_32220, partial [Opitutaceae bacterium]|nr:hypothetical protein [Opitutaceae bacterium]
WRIPLLTPEGWLGFVGVAPSLAGMALFWRIALSVLLFAAVVIAFRQRAIMGWRAASLAGPALLGYAYLQFRGATLGTNASYDAYKLLAVFFPGILPASLMWLRWMGSKHSPWRGVAFVLLTFVLLAHLRSVSQFFHALKSPPLRVTLALRDVRKIEAMPEVASLNMLIPDMWSRLWANAFLLRKPQYFATHTYEARRNSRLAGEWDLVGTLIHINLPGADSRRVNANYGVLRRRSPYYFQAEFGARWHVEEAVPETGERWCWSQQDPELVIDNPHPHPLRVQLTLDVQTVGPRELTAVLAEQRTPAIKLQDGRADVRVGTLELPPGRSVVTLHSPQPLVNVAGDPRPLGIGVRRIQFDVAAP